MKCRMIRWAGYVTCMGEISNMRSKSQFDKVKTKDRFEYLGTEEMVKYKRIMGK
jgi:hypothetical protein